MDEARTHEREVKKTLRAASLPEPFFASRYSFSPYMASGHGCAYCDGRAERYWVEGEFDRDIVVRTNVAERLGLMRQAAGVLLRHRMPASVLTKSSLVVRDLDLWRGVNDAGGSILSVSLVFADDGLRRIFEPGASPVDGRMAAMLGNPKLAGFLRGVAIDRRVFDYVNLRLE